MSGNVPNLDELDLVALFAGVEPVSGVRLPSDGPHVVERVRVRLETWQRIEAEAAARGIQPRELMAQLLEVALSPELQRVIAQLAQRTPPAA